MKDETVAELSLECPVCLEVFKKPWVAIDGFAYCYECAHEHRRRSGRVWRSPIQRGAHRDPVLRVADHARVTASRQWWHREFLRAPQDLQALPAKLEAALCAPCADQPECLATLVRILWDQWNRDPPALERFLRARDTPVFQLVELAGLCRGWEQLRSLPALFLKLLVALERFETGRPFLDRGVWVGIAREAALGAPSKKNKIVRALLKRHLAFRALCVDGIAAESGLTSETGVVIPGSAGVYRRVSCLETRTEPESRTRSIHYARVNSPTRSLWYDGDVALSSSGRERFLYFGPEHPRGIPVAVDFPPPDLTRQKYWALRKTPTSHGDAAYPHHALERLRYVETMPACKPRGARYLPNAADDVEDPFCRKRRRRDSSVSSTEEGSAASSTDSDS